MSQNPSDISNGFLVHHIAIAAHDPDALAKFYEDLFGLNRYNDPGIAKGSVWLSLSVLDSGTPGFILMLEAISGTAVSDPKTKSESVAKFTHKTSGYHLFSLRITPEERDPWLTKLRAAGVHIEGESAYSIFFRDPEGNRIGLSHYPVNATDFD